MARSKKENVAMSVRIDKMVYERMVRYCDESGQTKTLAIERALSLYMDEYYLKQKKLEQLEQKG